MEKKGILLAGGTGSRLGPLTRATSKQLLPIYDKPMIYYPLSLLMLAQIKKIAIVINPYQLQEYEMLLGDGSDLGLDISYIIQEKPSGIADAVNLSADFINKDNFVLILGDNFFYGHGLRSKLLSKLNDAYGASIFCYEYNNPVIYTDFENLKIFTKQIIVS